MVQAQGDFSIDLIRRHDLDKDAYGLPRLIQGKNTLIIEHFHSQLHRLQPHIKLAVTFVLFKLPDGRALHKQLFDADKVLIPVATIG